MISTPNNPTAVANQRRKPTLSPRRMIERAVTNRGETKPVAEAPAMGRKRKPEMKNSDEPKSAAPRASCKPGRGVRKAKIGELGTIAGAIIKANTKNLRLEISIGGYGHAGYFA